jgi:aquaporin NIP
MKKLLAEFIGTFTLVFVGTGAIVINDVTGGTIGNVGIALSFGLVVMAMIYTWGGVSGAHLNPAVTVGLSTAGRFRWKEAPSYILSQCLGALAASGVLKLLFPSHEKLGTTLPAGSATQSFILECLLTAILMLTILCVSKVAKENRLIASITIGGVIGLEAMFAGPICGASMNPARSLAPALVSGHLEHFWIYLTATVLGALVAALPAKILLPHSS